MELQVTLFDKSGKYKPVSTLIQVESLEYYNSHSKAIKQKAITYICQKKMWSSADLKRYGYTSCKVRVYDKERIEQENKERYERIKQERGWK